MELARATFRTAALHGRHRFWFLLTTALVLFVPLGLLESLDHGLEINTDDGVEALDVIEGFAIAVSAMVGEVFYAGAIASVVARGPEYEPHIPELLRRIPYLTIIALDLIVAFGVAFGAIFFLLPGLWLYGSWVLAATIADIDHIGVREALRRSNRLAKGHKATIVVTLLGITIFSELIAELLRVLVETLTHEELVIDWVASTASAVLLSPLFGLLAAAFVLELRARKAPAAAEAS